MYLPLYYFIYVFQLWQIGNTRWGTQVLFILLIYCLLFPVCMSLGSYFSAEPFGIIRYSSGGEMNNNNDCDLNFNRVFDVLG